MIFPMIFGDFSAIPPQWPYLRHCLVEFTALAERQQPKILAVQLDQVEGDQDRIAGPAPPVEQVKDSPSAPQTTVSPSSVNGRARSLAAAPAMAGAAVRPVVTAARE
jgi:hypothetical protein